MAVDYEAEGLLDGLDDERERAARIELIERLLADGATLDDVRKAAAEDRLPIMAIEVALGEERPTLTREQVAEQSGLSIESLRRLWRALGMAETASGIVAFTEQDVESAQLIKLALDAGLPEEGLLEISRVMGQSMSRLASATGGVFGETFLREAESEADLGARYAEATRALAPTVAPLITYVYDLHQRQLLRQNVIGRAELASGRAVGKREITVCFADLVGFTRLGERVEPVELGAVAGRLGDMAAEVAGEPVRLIKMIGDAAMLVSFEPEPLVDAALELVAGADEQGDDFPQLRAGIALGEAVGRAGDWYGRPVNLASRVCGIARPGSALATDSVKKAVGELEHSWSFAGKRQLKGVDDGVPLFRVRRGDEESEEGRSTKE